MIYYTYKIINFKKTIKALSTATVAGSMLLAINTPVLRAADFQGSLDSVSITDATGSNSAPVAGFTYTQDGDILYFDASDSNDPDGSITEYKWDFGNGTIAEGVTTSYTHTSDLPLKVNLTVVDNNGGLTIAQKLISLTGSVIYDDFSTDSTANYVVVAGKSLNIYDGALHTDSWSTTLAYYDKSTGSKNHSVEADITYQPEYGGGLLFRFDPSSETGYLAHFESGRLVIKTVQSGSASYLTMHIGDYSAGTYHLKLSIIEDSITASVDGNAVLNFNDTTYSSGTYTGVRLRAGSDPAPIWIDNLSVE